MIFIHQVKKSLYNFSFFSYVRKNLDLHKYPQSIDYLFLNIPNIFNIIFRLPSTPIVNRI